MRRLRYDHIETIEPRVEFYMSTHTTQEEVAKWVKFFNERNPDRLCIIDGTNRRILSRPRGMSLHELARRSH